MKFLKGNPSKLCVSLSRPPLHAKAREARQGPPDREGEAPQPHARSRIFLILRKIRPIEEEDDPWMNKYWHEKDWPEPLGKAGWDYMQQHNWTPCVFL